MQFLDPLQTTDGLSKSNLGLGKKWFAKSESQRKLMSEYMLKVKYSIQDFNETVQEGFSGAPKDVVYLIVLADWIKDSCWRIKGCLREDVSSGFKFSNIERLKLCREFLEAIRAIVVAHPVSVSKHREYGFDGGRICVDIRSKSLIDGYPGAKFYRLHMGGAEEVECAYDDDVVLATYSADSDNNGGLRFQRVCFDMADVRNAAQLYIDSLYELDRYVARLKKKDFV